MLRQTVVTAYLTNTHFFLSRTNYMFFSENVICDIEKYTLYYDYNYIVFIILLSFYILMYFYIQNK